MNKFLPPDITFTRICLNFTYAPKLRMQENDPEQSVQEDALHLSLQEDALELCMQ
jgi:hypothetical protein